MVFVRAGQILALIEDVLSQGGVFARRAGHEIDDVADALVIITGRAFIGGLGTGGFDFIIVAVAFLAGMGGRNAFQPRFDGGCIQAARRECGGMVINREEEVRHRTGHLLGVNIERHCFGLLSDGSTRRHTKHDPGGLVAQLFCACNSS